MMNDQDPINDKVTSGNHHSYWNDSVLPLEYDSLKADKITDVLIVSGGGLPRTLAGYCSGMMMKDRSTARAIYSLWKSNKRAGYLRAFENCIIFKINKMKNLNLEVLIPATLLMLSTMSCKKTGNDSMDSTSATGDSTEVRATGPEASQQQDTTNISPDSTQASPPAVSKPKTTD